MDWTHKDLDTAPCPKCPEGTLESQGDGYVLRCCYCACRVDPSDLDECMELPGYEVMLEFARERHVDNTSEALSEIEMEARVLRFKEVTGHSPSDFVRLYREGEIPGTLNNTLSFWDALFLASNEV